VNEATTPMAIYDELHLAFSAPDNGRFVFTPDLDAYEIFPEEEAM
jgi:hypothetical protein